MEQEYTSYLIDNNKTAGTIKTYILDLQCYKKWFTKTTGKQLNKLYRENIQDYISYLRNVYLLFFNKLSNIDISMQEK